MSVRSSSVCLALIVGISVFAHAAGVTISPSPLSFGSQVINTSSASKTLTITNNQTKALTITNISVSLSDFLLTNNCPMTPSTLGAGASCTVNVVFRPSALGARSGSFSLTDDGPGSPQKALINGTGIAAVTVNPTSLGFGNQSVGKQSAAQNVSLKNNQSVPLTINTITAGLSDYGVTTGCPINPKTLAAKASCQIQVTFTPKQTGSRNTTLTVNDNASNNPTVSLTGTGVAAVNVSPTSLPFGNQPVGTTSTAQAVTVTNNQSVALTITSITSSVPDFVVQNTCPVSPNTLAAGASCTANVKFFPKSSGSKSGTLNVNDDASGSPQTVSMTGTGTTGVTLVSIAVTPASGMVTVGNTLQLKATGTYSDSTTADITSSSTWTSSDSTVASIAAGLATGVSDGQVTVTAAQSGVTSPTATVNVGAAADFYVALNGNDAWSGKLFMPNPSNTDGPFATIGAAQAAVRTLVSSSGGRTAPITVLVRGGNYFQQSLSFSSADSGTSTLQVIWQNYPNETPVISAGMQVKNWTNIGNNTYQTTLPSNTLYFENLFYNGQRRLRPRLGGALGNYYRVTAPVYLSGNPPPSPPPDPNCGIYVSGQGWKCYDRFQYQCGDLSNNWQNLKSPYPAGDIELVIFELWDTSKLRVSSIDTQNCIAYMTGPAKIEGSHGFFANHRYVVENVKDAFTLAGQWFLDRSVTPWTLTYIANSGENPQTDTVVIPQNTQIMVATGLSYVTFNGLTFSHDNFVIGPLGYISLQQEQQVSGAVACYNCQHVTFDSVIVSQVSATGMEMQTTDRTKTTSNNTIQNSALYDIGVDGIRVGNVPVATDTDANVPQFTLIKNTLIEGFGRIIASGVGLAQGSGHDNTYTQNDIYDGYHSAIEICTPPTCPRGNTNSNGTFNNVISFNHVYDLFQGLTDDGGAIYLATGGADYSPTGNKVLNNRVHDTTDASIYDTDGYGAHGIYTDSSTGLVDIENNLIYRVSGFDLNMTKGPQLPNYANTIKNNIVAYGRLGLINNGNPYSNSTCPTTVVTIFNATNNIFYFDRSATNAFYVQRGCEYSCGAPEVQLHNWQSNLYWRTDGSFATDQKAFHIQPNPGAIFLCADVGTWTFYKFPQWQGLGEDIGGVVDVSPGFANPAYPNDDYSLPGGSPGVGFVPFDITLMGRQNPVIKPTNPLDIAPTFQTKTYNPATDY